MKNNPTFKFFYPLLIWIITLLLGPITWIIYTIYDIGFSDGIELGQLIFPLFFISIFMSFPTVLTTVIAYVIATNKTLDSNLIRLLLLLITLIGIWITVYEIGGTLKFQLAISYSMGAFIAVAFTTPEKKDEKSKIENL